MIWIKEFKAESPLDLKDQSGTEMIRSLGYTYRSKRSKQDGSEMIRSGY